MRRQLQNECVPVHRPAALDTRILLALGGVALLAAVAAGILIWQFYPRPIPDFNKLGGTVLLYEVDTTREKVDVTDEMVKALRRRLDPTGMAGILVSSPAKNKLDIRVPKVGDHKEEVLKIKQLVARVGRLEFRVLANEVDDKMAIREAKQWINSAVTDVKIKEELERLAKEGLPPPGPHDADTKELKKYQIALPGNQKSWVTYSWIELGKAERKALGFSKAARKNANPQRKQAWAFINANRNKAVQVNFGVGKQKVWHGALFYSRNCVDRNLPAEERKEKKHDYFVLARNPEFVDKKGKPDAKGMQHAVDGRYLIRAYEDSSAGSPMVGFTFNAKGANLFGRLTRTNVPSGKSSEGNRVKRHLAIILDGFVMSAPTINSEIRSRGVITGDFTQREVQNLVTILRSGALPAALNPIPLSETTVEPKK